jgi:hypothetical protein
VGIHTPTACFSYARLTEPLPFPYPYINQNIV